MDKANRLEHSDRHNNAFYLSLSDGENDKKFHSISCYSFFLTLHILSSRPCFSAEGQDPHNEFPRYDTKRSDCEVPVILGI